MNDRDSLERRLAMAKQALAILEAQVAGHGITNIPVNMLIDLTEKRKEVESVEAMLAGNSGALFPNTLPRRDMFFGREKEMARVMHALTPEDRSWGALMDGIGGIGKTALAIEIAYRCQDAALFDAFLFATAKQTRLDPGGECDLRNAADLDSLLATLARALGETGVLQAPAVEKPQALIEALRRFSGPQRRVLLVLDNLETLPVAEQQAAVEFLRQLPLHCKGLATSRKRAGDGAVFVRLEQLEWNAAHQIMAEEARRDAGLARALEQAGEANWQTLHDAAGGSPLALRWALGLMRQRHLSLERAVALLHGQQADDLLQFMYREARSDMAANDWQVLGALSLFAAPASFDALAATTGLSRLALEAATERLSAYALVDVGGPDGPYSLHPLTRRMAADELANQPEFHKVIASAFVRYWQEFTWRYRGSDEEDYQGYDQLELQWLNIESAMEILYSSSGLPHHLIDKDAAQMLINLARALAKFLWFRGYWDERLQVCSRAYDAAIRLGDWHNTSWRAYDITWIHYQRADITQAEDWINRMEYAMNQAKFTRSPSIAARMRGKIAELREDYNAAIQCHTKAFEISRKFNDEKGEAIALVDLCAVEIVLGEHENANEHCTKALKINEALGDNHGLAVTYGKLGELSYSLGHLAEAKTLTEKALHLTTEIGRQDLIAENLYRLACILEKEQDIAKALEFARSAMEIERNLHSRHIQSACKLVEHLQNQIKTKIERYETACHTKSNFVSRTT